MTQQKHSGESFMKQKETRLYQKEENIPIYPLSTLVNGEEAISPTSICFPVFYYLGNRETRHERANYLGTYAHTQSNTHKQSWKKLGQDTNKRT